MLLNAVYCRPTVAASRHTTEQQSTRRHRRQCVDSPIFDDPFGRREAVGYGKGRTADVVSGQSRTRAMAPGPVATEAGAPGLIVGGVKRPTTIRDLVPRRWNAPPGRRSSRLRKRYLIVKPNDEGAIVAS